MTGFDLNRFPHGRWLLCAPKHFDVSYEINPWMDIKRGPHSELASHQWQCLHHTLLRLGAWVEYIDPVAGHPDLVFTANAGLVRGQDIVLSKFAFSERAGEEPLFRAWFEKRGYTVHEVSKGSFEGEGDALFCGQTLFAGHGFRSSVDAYGEVAKLLNVSELVLCELINPRFYHLDTCFCPIDESRAIFVPAAFSKDSIARMEKYIELIAVDDEDAERFVCNSVVLGKDLIQPAGCDKTARALETLGFQCHPVALGEFLKGGGSAKCLSLYIDRNY